MCDAVTFFGGVYVSFKDVPFNVLFILADTIIWEKYPDFKIILICLKASILGVLLSQSQSYSTNVE